MASLRHHDDGRPIEVVDTFFTEDLLEGTIFRLSAAPPDIIKSLVVVDELSGFVIQIQDKLFIEQR
jgi:hypothetical protein